MTGAPREIASTPAERQRLERLRALVDSGAAGIPELLSMRTDPSWSVRREVIAALGELGEAALGPLVLSLVDERDDETRIAATVDALVASAGDVDARLGALQGSAPPAVLCDIGQILGRRRHPASVPALAQLSQHADDNVAVAAIEGLGRIGGRAVVDLLVRAVQSGSFFRTFAAIDVLGKSGDPRAVAPLAVLLNDPHYAFEAARALGRTCDPAAVEPLGTLLASPIDGLVRVSALALAELRQRHGERFGTTAPIDVAIRRTASRASTRRLVQCASSADTSEQVAIGVVLGGFGDETAAPALLRWLDSAAPVAQAAAEALERISSDAEDQLLAAIWEGNSARRQMLLPRVRSARAADAALACLTDTDGGVRRLACEALARIGSRRAVPELFETLQDSMPGVVQAATAAIISLGHDETPVLASAAAQSPSLGVRRAALRILSHLGSPQAFGVLDAATRDSNQRVREAAITGLAPFELPEARARLLELADDAVPSTRALALRTLGEGGWGDAAVSERLGAALGDADAWVRYYACQAIGKLRLELHVAGLAACATDAAGQVRVAAIEALSHLPGDTAFAAVLEAARSPEVDLRRAALIGLGLSRRREAASVLLAEARSEDAATRLITLSALARIDAPETLTALTEAVHDPDQSVRMAALGFLGERDGAEATQRLASFLLDPALGERAHALLSEPRQHRVAGISAALQAADDERAALLTGLLARARQPDAVAALFEAVTFANVAARRAAATTLRALGSREALATLQRLSAEDADPEVRRVCALLLAQ
ncbi:MAG TPA: HEAT repeat domain-containing protein [Polyangiaceae bacterium]|nr:HEAT repeat domain-containing protein [Polyangiaceae bacterium]